MVNPAPWLPQYEPGVPAALPATDDTLHGLVERAAAGSPGYPALSFYGRSTGYAELDTAAERVATTLRTTPGYAPGTVVALDLPNGPHWVICALGALKAGGVVAPLGEAPERLLAWRRPAVCLATAENLARRRELLADHGVARVCVNPAAALPRTLRAIRALSRRPARGCAEAVPWPRWLAPKVQPAGAGTAAIGPDHAALATVAPDGSVVVLSHRQLVAGAASLSLWLTDAVVGDETWLMLASLATAVGCVAALGTAVGMRARVVLLPSWTGRDALDAIRYTRPAYVLADAVTVARLVAEPGLEQAQLGVVRAFLVGDLVPSGVSRAFAEAAGVELCLGYAPPGAAGLATCNPVNGRRVPGSLGVPLPGVDARVVGPDGQPLPPGVPGGLELTTPGGPPGWLRTGLAARQDPDGFLHPAGA